MTDATSIANCQYCSVVSKANGEDPSGTAGDYEAFLLIEAKPPWSGAIWLEAGAMPQPVVDALQQAWDRGLNLRPLVIAPDRAYSELGWVRVLFYQRPTDLFSQFERQEFFIPSNQLAELVTAILNQPEELPRFHVYRQTAMLRDLFVCTHGNYDVACSRFGYPIYQQLRRFYSIKNQLRIWRCSHFGGHEFAPTLIDLPTGHYWGHLEPTMLGPLIHQNGDVAALRRFYRGWAGLSRFEQIAEREIWMQIGWEWLNYLKSGQVLAIDPTNPEAPDWAEIVIHFADPQMGVCGTYEARIEVHCLVQSAENSGHNQPRREVKQYRVSHLHRIT